MQVTVPTFLPEPWANQGQSATIPDTTTETGRASWAQGFPTVTALPSKAGGIPPNYLDFQGALQALSSHVFFQQSGSLYTWSASLDYLVGAHVLGSDGKEYVAIAASGPDVSAGAQDPIDDTNATYWLEINFSSINLCNAFRQSMIGVPIPWRSTTLPSGFAWANGSLVIFDDYPELESVYNAGGFSGMLLAWDASEETIAANLGQWRPNAAQPTGLYLPSLGGQFFQAWVPGSTGQAGAWGQDQIRNISGLISIGGASNQNAVIGTASGAFSVAKQTTAALLNSDTSGAVRYTQVVFNASTVVPTGTQNVPQHVWTPYIIYLGLTA